MMFALNALTGDLLWKTPFDSSYPNGVSATTVAEGAVYVTVYVAERYGGGEIYAFNMTTGELLWEYAPPAWLSSSPAVADGKVYVGTSTGEVLCFNALTGQMLWDYYVRGAVGSNSSSGSGYQVTNSLTVSNGVVYIGATPELLLALNASNGAYVWGESLIGNSEDSCPAVGYGTLYLGTTPGGSSSEVHVGGVSALNATTGSLIWNQPIGSITCLRLQWLMELFMWARMQNALHSLT
jgi:outer membrane protein assembly factor BamB